MERVNESLTLEPRTNDRTSGRCTPEELIGAPCCD